MKNNLSTIFAVAIGIVIGGYVILFAIANRGSVSVDLIVAHPKLPLYVVAATFLVCGGAVVGIFAGVMALRARGRRRKLERRIEAQDEELRRMRNAPLTDPVGTPSRAPAEADGPRG